MARRILTVSAALLLAATTFAVPAKRIKRQVQQPDGTTLTIMTRGDENFHFTSTEDGEPLVLAADGSYHYAMVGADGKLAASGQVAHNAGSRTQAELAFLAGYADESRKVRSLGAKRAAQRNASRQERLARRAMAAGVTAVKGPNRQTWAGAGGGEGIGVTGDRKGLVILVNFQDKKMKSAHTRDEFDRFFNAEGYNTLGNSGSVHDYFYSQSYGKFNLTFDVLGPVTVSKNMAAYGANDSNGDDIDPAGMVVEACKLAYEQNPVDMSQYDWDGDGAVDQVYIVYAGYSEASDGGDDCIWPHEWDIQDGGYSLVLGGRRIRTYGCSSELSGNTGSDMAGIGTACHEFSHCMGIPDLYDTDYSDGFGMGEWDLMDYGSYAGEGYKPVGYNTYEKWVSGWMEPTVLDSPCLVSGLKPLSEEPESYIVYNDKTPTEYYILENRQLTGTDSELPAHGMLVIHVDYDVNAWTGNAVNDDVNHQRFTIVPADNKLSIYNEYADTYPGTTGNNELTDTSTPAAKLFNANADGRKYLGKPVTSIYESPKGQISFTFMGGVKVDTPDNLASENVVSDGFKAVWGAVDGADSYNVQIKEKVAGASVDDSRIIAEDLSGWGEGKKQDGTTDVSSKLDDMMANPGWTGSKVFEGIGCAKLGSAKAQGWLTSPLVATHNSQSVTMRVRSAAYGNDEAEATLTLTDADGNEIAQTSITPDGGYATCVMDNAAEGDYHVTVKPKKRGYVYEIGVYDGSFDESDFADEAAAPRAVAAMRAAQQFDGIGETAYTFSGLNANGVYQWRVQAVKEDVQSAWTAWQTVDLGAQAAINGVGADVELAAATVVRIYSPAGVYLGTAEYGRFMLDTRYHGMYVLQYDGGTVRVVR